MCFFWRGVFLFCFLVLGLLSGQYLLKFLSLTIVSLLLSQIPFVSDTNMIIHLLYPRPRLWQYQNNNISTSTNHMITENNLRFLFAVPFVPRVYSLGTHRLPYLKVTWRNLSLFMLQAQNTVLFCSQLLEIAFWNFVLKISFIMMWNICMVPKSNQQNKIYLRRLVSISVTPSWVPPSQK